jgi:hypothetical protein
MLADNKNFREAAHIGQEIMGEPGALMRGKFSSVYDTVTKGIFTLDRALKLYKMPYDVYVALVAKKHAEEIEDQGKYDTKKQEMIFKLDIYEKLLEGSLASSADDRFVTIITLLKEFSREIDNETLILK